MSFSRVSELRGDAAHTSIDRPVDGATVVIADDHALVRAGLRMIVEDEGFAVIAEAGTIEETRRKTRAYKPDILILDVSMPDGSSLDAIPALAAASPQTAIVVLTMEADPRLAHAALRTGALGFVLKEAADTELIDAMRAALGGNGYLDPQLGAQIAIEPTAVPGPPDGLTPRELEVLTLIARGHTNAEIARQLHVNSRTVETHRSHIQHKTHHQSRAELVAYAAEHELVRSTRSRASARVRTRSSVA
jgi:two-component system response regulator NreC